MQFAKGMHENFKNRLGFMFRHTKESMKIYVI